MVVSPPVKLKPFFILQVNRKTHSLLSSIRFVACSVFFTCSGYLSTQPQVDVAEVIRRGGHVELIGGICSDNDKNFCEAVATPPDDSNKWYVTVLSQSGCKPCERLKYDLQTDKSLTAFVNPTDPKKSWAHYNTYSSDDETQMWRFKGIKIKGYPTTIIQPPRNGRYGDPSTVVYQKTGYDGNGRKLAESFSDSIKKYIATVKKNPLPTPALNPVQFATKQLQSVMIRGHQAKPDSQYPRYNSSDKPSGGMQAGLWGQDTREKILPFKPRPKDDPQPVSPPSIDPQPTPGITPDLSIPSPLDPDAKPVAPQADPNVQPTGPPKPETKTIVVVFDGESGVNAEADVKLRDRLAELRQKYKDHKVDYISFQREGRKLFPKLSPAQLPAIQVVDADGNTLEATTPPIDSSFPWAAVISFFTTGMTNPLLLTPLAGWLLVAVYNRRKANKKKQLLNDQSVLFFKGLIDKFLGGESSTPTPSATPSSGIDLSGNS